MGIRERRKGKVGEREAAKFLSELLGVPARRGVQYQGTPNSPDIVTELPGVYWEIKRCHECDYVTTLNKAFQSCASDIPVVMQRSDRRPWLILLYERNLEEFARLVRVATDWTVDHQTMTVWHDTLPYTQSKIRNTLDLLMHELQWWSTSQKARPVWYVPLCRRSVKPAMVAFHATDLVALAHLLAGFNIT